MCVCMCVLQFLLLFVRLLHGACMTELLSLAFNMFFAIQIILRTEPLHWSVEYNNLF